MTHGRRLQVALVLILVTASMVWAQGSTGKFLDSGRRGYLGIVVQDITPETARGLGLPEPSGILITNVRAGSAAEAAGLKQNDVILSYNGTRVEGVSQFHRLIRETPAGRTVTLGILRNGQESQLQATLGSRQSARLRLARRGRLSARYDRKSRLGVQTISLTQQLAAYFGVQTGRGVLVTSVAETTPAAKAGLRAGDVILAVDGQNVDGWGDLRPVLRQKEGPITLTIMRDHVQQELQATLEPRGRGASLGNQRRYQRHAGRHRRVL